jgi:hypothetical protein
VSSSPPQTATSSSAASTLTFGQAHHFRDGLTVTIDAPSVYQRPQADPQSSPEALLKIHVTVLNGTAAPYAMTGPGTLELVATVNGQPAVHQPVDQPPAVVSPAGTLLPGQTQSFDTVYSLPPQVGDLVVTVTDRVSNPEVVFYRGSTPAPASVTAIPSVASPTDTPSTGVATTSEQPGPSLNARGYSCTKTGCVYPDGSQVPDYKRCGVACGEPPTSGDIQSGRAAEPTSTKAPTTSHPYTRPPPNPGGPLSRGVPLASCPPDQEYGTGLYADGQMDYAPQCLRGGSGGR